jgi:integrase/recombinase XerD
MQAKRAAKRVNFVSPNEKAKSAVVAQLVRIARKARLGYDDFLYISQQARKKLGLRRGRKERRLPQLLADADLKRFFRAIQDCGDVQHEILLKLLFYTAVRVSELVHIEVGDVDLDACKIFINRGKGAKDRYILFPASFRLVLKSHLHAAPRNRYLFETRRFGPFTTRRIQQIVQGYREMAGHYAAAAPASVPPSDADLLDVQRPHRRTDSADFRPRKQKESRGLPTPVTRIGR